MRRNLLALGLSLALVLALAAGCAGKPAAESTPPPETEPPAVETPGPAPETGTPEESAQQPTVRLGLLKGPTGMGAAKLLADNDAGETALRYEAVVGSDPATDIVPKLINGELDVAAVPTNLAATLYNKDNDSIRLLALNTLGVLHILEKGGDVRTMADLAGRTLYATGQGANPEYVLNYLLEQNGLVPGEDVTVEWRASDEVSALMASGEIDLCLLPVPAATSVMAQNPDVRDAVDLNDAWEDAGAPGTFTMGCLVARAGWLAENQALADALLREYRSSIEYAVGHPEEAAALMERYGIVPKAPIAQAAIPQANMVYVDGEDLLELFGYYKVLHAANPTSIGGSIPDDAFYYIP